MATCTEAPGESVPPGGLTEAPLLDADQVNDVCPSLVSVVVQIQLPPVGLLWQPLGTEKMVGLTTSLGGGRGVGVGVGVGLGVGVGVGLGVAVGVGVGKAVTMSVTPTGIFAPAEVIVNVVE